MRLSIKDRLLSKMSVNVDTGCWEWTGYKNNNGYGTIGIDRRMVLAHRASFSVFKGPIPKGHVVMHSCDNRKCINPAHLSAGTQSDNIKDALNKGRVVVPSKEKEEHWNARLTEAAVSDIRTSTLTNKQLALKYAVSPRNIALIKQRKAWRSVV